jgi:hypothetical protein
MTFWADNIKFIKDISDAKYKKIEHAVQEVGPLCESPEFFKGRLGANLAPRCQLLP